MQKVFWDDPYQTLLNTKVQAITTDGVLFDATIAFSFSGGQESDTGAVNGFSITGSTLKGHDIYYTLESGHNLHCGDEVVMKIDWPRRYALMRLHFAAELILELVSRHLHCPKIGAHISATKARIDFTYPHNISHCFEHILTQYNEIIADDLPIHTDFSDIKRQQRYWEIEGFSRVPCGGTHVKSTAEVGAITLKRKNRGASKERVEITLQASANA